VGPALNCTCKLPSAFDCRNICDPEANCTVNVTFTPSGRSYNSSRRLKLSADEIAIDKAVLRTYSGDKDANLNLSARTYPLDPSAPH
jgi:hypothetical protein